MAHNLFSFFSFFVLFVLNDLGLSFTLSPGLVQVSFQFTSFCFLLYHLVLWIYYTFFVDRARLLPVRTYCELLLWSNHVFVSELVLLIALIWPQCILQGPVFCINSQNYKLPERYCVSGLSVNSPEISDQIGKYHPLLHLLAPVFQIMWTMTHSRWGYMCRFMEICSTFVGLSYCVVTLDEKTIWR